MTMFRVGVCAMASILPLTVACARAQDVSATPKPELPKATFDVSTIKPTGVDDDSVSINWGIGTYTAKNVQVDALLSSAFSIRENLITGLPAWAKSNHYDVVAKASDIDLEAIKKLPREQRDELMSNMMRQLLEERFHVKAHTELKELPVYDLVLAKGGAKFDASGVKLGTADCKGWISSSGSTMKMECVSIEMLARNLEYRVDRTVIDKTNLPKTLGYNMGLKWRRETQGAASDSDLELPTITDALQEQLGLKLEISKGPVKTLVVDQMDRPTEN